MIKHGKWIWNDAGEKINSYMDFKRSFDARAGQELEIELSVDGNYALYLNDHFVDSGQYPDYPEYKVYDHLNLKEFLKDGVNELLIRVWWPGVDHFSYRAEAAGLIYVLYSGNNLIAASDEKTLCAENSAFQSGEVPNITEQLGFTFLYNAKKEGKEVFHAAKIIEKEATLVERPIQKLMIGERAVSKINNYGSFKERPYEYFGQRMQNAALSPRYWGPDSIWDQQNGTVFSQNGEDGIYLIFDLGKEMVGYADFDLELPEDALILCGWGEHLQDLRVRSFVGGRNFLFSYHAKAGRNQFMMPLRRLGLRYLQLHIYAPSVRVYYAGIRPTDYPHQPHPIHINDLLHRKIYETSIATLHHCMHDHYEDCPWREQGLYTMDSRNQMLCTYAIYKEADFAKASLRLIGLSVRDDGMVELCAPARVARTIPSFTAAYLMQLWDYLEYSGDGEFIKEMLPYAEKIAKAFEQRIDPDLGVLPSYADKKYWNFYEWQDGLNGRVFEGRTEPTYDAPLCGFVSMAFQSMEKIYRTIGEALKADEYHALWQKLNLNSHRMFWNGHCYDSYCTIKGNEKYHQAELTQALMICSGICPEEYRADLRALLMSKNDLYSITLSYNIFKYDAILSDPQNVDWVMDNIAKVWGNMLFNGATTFYETEKGHWDFHNAGSLCHGWAAIPIYYYHKYGNV